MTLDEAIKHAEKVAEDKENEGKLLCQSEAASTGCLTCAEEHRQLAEWLKDYKRLKEQETKTGRWVENDRGIPICSCCGKYKYEDIDGSIYDDVWFPNYCPNCGAKMIEPKERSCEG